MRIPHLRSKKILRRPLAPFLTDHAAQTLTLARQKATSLGHDQVSAEHLLLGLLDLNTGVAVRALSSLGISLPDVRDELEQHMERGTPFAVSAERVLELSRRMAFEHGHRYIGTEHILLGLVAEGHGVAAQVLARLGADLPASRHHIRRVLHGETV